MWLPQWSNYSCPLVERSKSSFSVSGEMSTLNLFQFNPTKQLFGRWIKHLENSAFFFETLIVQNILIVFQWRIAAEASWYEGHDTLSLVQFPTSFYNWLFWHFYHFHFQPLLFLAVQNSSIGDLVTNSLTHSLTHSLTLYGKSKCYWQS